MSKLAFFVVAALAGFGAAAASAATITIEKFAADLTPAVAEADVLAPTSISGGFFLNATDSVGGLRRSPYDTVAGLAATGKYHSVQGGGTMTYAFNGDQSSFGILWGSPDPYNTLSFFNNNIQIDLGAHAAVSGMGITGAEVAALPLTQPTAVGLTYIVFSGFLFDEVRLASTSNAFEFGQIATSPAPVPLPAAAWMLIAGLGALVAAGRRRTV